MENDRASQSSTMTLQVISPADGRTLSVTVRRRQVKNLNLRVRANGEVVLSIPPRTSRAFAQAFLDRKAAWIFAHVEARRSDPLEPCGGSIPLWGNLVPFSGTAQDVTALYKREVSRALPAVARRYEDAMGRCASWQIRCMATRWGSCTPERRSIRINARLAAYPPACLDAVVAHELVHLIEPSHNERFHMLLDCYCPHNREATALLKHTPQHVAPMDGTHPKTAGEHPKPD